MDGRTDIADSRVASRLKSFITRIVFKKENNLRPTFGDVDRQTVIIFLIISLLEHSSEVKLEKNWSGSKKVTFFAQLLFRAISSAANTLMASERH